MFQQAVISFSIDRSYKDLTIINYISLIKKLTIKISIIISNNENPIFSSSFSLKKVYFI